MMDDTNIKITEPRPYADHELLTEIFGFVPATVLDDMFNLANILFYKFMEGTASKLIAARPDKLRDINTALEEYERKTEKQLDQLFNVLQQYIAQDTWHIPQDLDIQLDQHKDIKFNVTDQDNQEMDDKLTKLREKIAAQKKFKAILNKTHEDMILKNTKIDTQLQELNLLNDIPRQEKVNNVNDSLSFIKNQLDLLQSTVVSSIEKAPPVPTEDHIQTTERTKYLRGKIAEAIKNL